VYALADDASDELRSQLAARTGRAAEVTVVPRRESFDAYA
jgi:propanediol dehydratase small subunit